MRLIDADALDFSFDRRIFGEADEHYTRGADGAISIVNSAQMVDAIEVIRCKDCKHKGGTHLYTDKIYCKRLSCYMEENDFCSYGERGMKEGA